MRYDRTKRYELHGSEIRLVQVFNHRGVIYRFVYVKNNSCFDLRPGESLPIEEMAGD